MERKTEDKVYRLYNQIGKFFTIFAVLFSLLIIYWLVLKLTNHSPAIEQVTLGLLFPLLFLVFKNISDMAKLRSDVRHIEKRFNLELNHTNQKLGRFEIETNKKLDRLQSEFTEFKDYVYQKL